MLVLLRCRDGNISVETRKEIQKCSCLNGVSSLLCDIDCARAVSIAYGLGELVYYIHIVPF